MTGSACSTDWCAAHSRDPNAPLAGVHWSTPRLLDFGDVWPYDGSPLSAQYVQIVGDDGTPEAIVCELTIDATSTLDVKALRELAAWAEQLAQELESMRGRRT